MIVTRRGPLAPRPASVESMEEQHQLWQREWRRLMGLPVDDPPPYEDDFSLHFDAWDRSESDILRLLAALDCPADVVNRTLRVRRANRQLKAHTEKVPPDKELLFLADQVVRRLGTILHREPETRPIRVEHGDWQHRRDFFKNASVATEALDDAILAMVAASCDRASEAAAYFLAEPLYQLTTYYEPRNWILWGFMVDAHDTDPYQPAMELWCAGAQVGEDDEGPFLFVTDH